MRWLTFVASLVLLLCTTEAVRVSLRSSSPPPATHYGPEAYDSFASVVGRVGDNAVAEERFLRTNLMETRSQCRHEIRKLKQSLKNHQTILTAANKTHTLNLHKANVSRTHILELEPIIEAKKQMLNALEMDINAGEVHMKQAHEIAHNKTHDAKVVITAVRALFSLLSAMNGAPDLPRPSKPAMFMFRQKLKDAKQHIKDPNVMRFLQTAMSSMSASGTTPSGSDLAKLQLLLSLLQAQMKDYIASVKDNIKLEKDNWDTQITQMDQQRLLLKKEIDEREADVAKLRASAEGAELAAKGNNATLHGPEVKEIKLLTEQLNVTKHDCRRKLHNIKVALIQIQKQLHVTSSVGDMQFTPDDNNLLGHISANVEPPKKTLVDSSGKRCCRMCSAAKGLKACGDSCIESSSSCSSVEGCACTDRD